MTEKTKKPAQPVSKPFLTGAPRDERTVKEALGFFGVVLLSIFMCFIICSMLSFESPILRIGMNALVVGIVLLLFFNNASGRGAEGVARGEILLQRQQKGLTFSESERALCYHPAKGFLVGLLGTLPLLILALLLAFTATRQTTGVGVLPSWLSVYQRRSEVGDALVAYTAQSGLGFAEILRLAVRIMIMPFVAMVGAENRDGLLLIERLSPLLVLLPALCYGFGYLQGRTIRTQVHTEIATANRKRARREKKARLARRNRAPKGPEQLN